MSAGVTAAPKADPFLVTRRFSLQPVNGIEPICRHIHRINDLAHLLDLGYEAVTALFSRRGPGEDHTRVAGSPSPVIERHYEVSGAREVQGYRPQSRGSSSPTMRHQNCW